MTTFPSSSSPALFDRWCDEVRRDELDRPLAARADSSSVNYGLGPLGDRLRALAQEMDLLGQRAALHWLDVTEQTLQGWPELTRIELVRDHQNHPRWEDYTPRNEPERLPVRYPQVTMWEGGFENTVNDPYIDGFEPWAAVWSPSINRAFEAALIRIVEACPHGIGPDDLGRARQAVLGEVGVALEGERLRAAIDQDTTGPAPADRSVRRGRL